jgi:2-oxoglutarate dehydrogenase E2 component (dihydrolipoamide succinyltransferase)
MPDILLPSDQTEGTTNTVGKWFKRVGDRVTANEPLLEITTDKVTVEIAAPADGVLVEILAQEGEEVQPGAVLGRIGSGETASTAPVAAPAAAGGPGRTAEFRPLAMEAAGAEAELSPPVRRLLKEHRLDPRSIRGTGRGGRITVEDVEAHLAGAATEARAGPPAGRRVPHSAMRRSIATHMVQSVAVAPHVTSVFEADLSAILAHRAATRTPAEARGVKLTLTAYFVRASVDALRSVPEVNSRWHDDALELFDDCNVGVATALERGGLIVPVIRRAQDLDLVATAERLQDLTARARAGSLTPGEVQGGTFTISNHGVSGSLVATPIVINQPQSAILGVGKLQQRPVVASDGRIVARPMVYVTLTIDHRVLDGFQANAFLTRWVDAVERWGGA